MWPSLTSGTLDNIDRTIVIFITLHISLNYHFGNDINKNGSEVLLTVVNVSWGNIFLGYCNNHVEICGMYNDDLNACFTIIMIIWCSSISGELRSNVSVL